MASRVRNRGNTESQAVGIACTRVQGHVYNVEVGMVIGHRVPCNRVIEVQGVLRWKSEDDAGKQLLCSRSKMLWILEHC